MGALHAIHVPVPVAGASVAQQRDRVHCHQLIAVNPRPLRHGPLGHDRTFSRFPAASLPSAHAALGVQSGDERCRVSAAEADQ
jgi:hypothetical protein